jgi:hypothetical protein
MENAEIKKELKLAWPVETGPALFVNNATIQWDAEGVAYLTFYQATPPVVMGTPEEQLEKFKQLEHIEARPIVKLALTRDLVKKLSNLLSRTLDDQR